MQQEQCTQALARQYCAEAGQLEDVLQKLAMHVKNIMWSFSRR
jgi:hypothetical protein